MALEQAAAFIEETDCSFRTYLGLLKQHETELLSSGALPEVEYPSTVLTTWELAFRRVAERNPAAADLLKLCAFLAPEAIPREVLAQHSQTFPEPLGRSLADPLLSLQIIKELRRFSLVEVVDDQTLGVHRLVQGVTRADLEKSPDEPWPFLALLAINSALTDPSNPQQWSLYERLLPHALMVVKHTESLRYAGAATAEFSSVLEEIHSLRARLLSQTGLFLTVHGQYDQARSLLERAVNIIEPIVGSDHEEVSIIRANLAAVYLEQGDLVGARQQIETALDSQEHACGDGHPATPITLGLQAGIVHEQGNLKDARLLHECALALRESALGPDHPDIAMPLSNLATVLRDQGHFEEARALQERALAIHETALGPNHPSVANSLNNLATTVYDLGDLDGAQSLQERAIAILEAAFGPDHPHVAISLENLAFLDRKLENFVAARKKLERALKIYLDRDDARQAMALLYPFTMLRVAELRHELQLQRSNPPSHEEMECFEQLSLYAFLLGKVEGGVRLMLVGMIIKSTINSSETEMDAQKVLGVARLAGRNEVDENWLQELRSQMEAEYAKDRGRSLVNITFDETDFD